MKRSKSPGGLKVRLRNKCGTRYVLRANNKLRDTEADKRLTQLICQRIEATPFKWCMYLKEEIRISGILLKELISRWSQDGGGFRVGTRVIHFTPLDVCFALGLRIKGEPVERNEQADSHTRALFEDDRITLEVIYENLLLCMTEQRVDDFCRVYIILAFAEFYFPNTSNFVNMSMFRLLDELDSLHRYNWGMAVHDNLVGSLNRAAQNFNESKNIEDLWVSGCVAALQVWALEHLHMRPTSTIHQIKFPRVLSWVNLGINKKLITSSFHINNVQENLVITNEDRDYDVLREALTSRIDGFCEISNPSFAAEGCHCGYQVLEEENRQLKEQVVRLEKEVVFIKGILREQGLLDQETNRGSMPLSPTLKVDEDIVQKVYNYCIKRNMTRKTRSASSKYNSEVLVRMFGQHLTRADVNCMRPREWVNNFIFMLASKFLMAEQKTLSSYVSRYIFCASLVEEISSELGAFRSGSQVCWNEKKLFSSIVNDIEVVNTMRHCKLIFAPALFDCHWFCYVLDLEKHKLFVLDSLHSWPTSGQIELHRLVGSCFVDILSVLNPMLDREKIKLEAEHIDLPKQLNCHDCGIYVLMYLEMWDGKSRWGEKMMPEYSEDNSLALCYIMNPYSDQPHVSHSFEVHTEVHCSQTVEDTVSSPKATLGSQSEEQEIKPGMSFESVDALKTFYRDYGIRKGFGFMVRNSRKGKDGNLNYIILACSREGNYVSPIPTQLKTNPTSKNRCPAKITAVLNKNQGRWNIYKVELDHCHDLSPGKARLFHGNRNISMHARRTIEVNDEAGVRLNKSFRSLVQGAGGYENLPFVERDVRNLVGKERRALGKEGDGKALLSYFTQMQQKNADFFYEIDLDDNLRVRNVFWADARSREMCKYFGDVVSFDTTYLTNKYDMPFAPFVGVNHHGQSVLLGCGLISSEDTDTFAWLFETWKRCMFGNPPQGIITDQCKAMKKAIHFVFPDAQHRWCLWHIMKKIPEKFKGHGQYKEIKKDMKEVVYDTLDVTEFDSQWNTFIDKYGLRNNDWLTGLYLERSRWVPCFLKNYFWAGMSTTQRSESMNAFFDGYINSKTSLQQFVLQYSNALRDKAEKEYEADFQSSTTTIHCATTSVIEGQFQKQYTNKKFMEIQAEFRGKMNCLPKFLYDDGSILHYEVIEEICIAGRTREVNFKVIFHQDTHDISCTCLLFQFKGIMCRHSFLVLANERVKQIPSKYVLDRWSKNLRRTYTNIKCSYNLKHMQPQVERYDKLCDAFHKVAELASASPEDSELLAKTVQAVGQKVKAAIATRQNQQAQTQTEHPQGEQSADQNQATPDGHGLILSPVRKPRRGRPPYKRKMSTTEKVVKRTKAARNRRQNEVNNQTSSPWEHSVHERGQSSTVRSTVDITNWGAHIATDLVRANVDTSGNDVIYSQNCWPSQLSNVTTTGFVSLRGSTQNDVSAGYNA